MSARDVPLPPVGRTALGVAAIRAAEAQRPDPLFVDPLAAAFVSAARGLFEPGPGSGSGPGSPPGGGRRPSLVSWVRLRTRFLDDVLADAVAGGCRQLVILGAGLDVRAFRTDWPAGTRVWELDLPAVLDFKQGVLDREGWSPRCDRRVVPGDLAGDWAGPLLAAGFDPARPSAWVAEGLLAYLEAQVRDRLIGRAAELAAPSSRFALTLSVPGRREAWRAEHPDLESRRGHYVALWGSDTPEDAGGWLAGLGWMARLFDSRERAEHYGLSAQADRPSGAWLVDATRAGPSPGPADRRGGPITA